MLRYAKTGWPRLKKYQLFKGAQENQTFKVVCSECGVECEVPFQPKAEKPVFCQKCWSNHKPVHNRPRRGRKNRKTVKH
ncbi:hypothetical protein GX563_10915 [Candidatus Bathyarchaeota archaeon]|nr:hypothetical protein [Candidatus Bathyarchaeota archaeon]